MPGAMQEILRILVVEDDVNLLDLLMDGLRENRAYEVDGARDGYEGLARVEAFKPHLLILDLQLPGLDGFQVCRKVKASPATQSIKVLATSASREGRARERIPEAGAECFLEKPFGLDELRAEVARLLGTVRG